MTINQVKAQRWSVNDIATYKGQVFNIERIEGLLADLQGADGHIIRDAHVSLLRPVSAAIRPAVKVEEDTMSPGPAPALDLSGVEAAMARPTVTWEELVESPIQEPVTIQPEPAAPAAPAARRKKTYRPEGYLCELCPDLPPFPRSVDKARHAVNQHPKVKREKVPAPQADPPAPSPANGSFRSGLYAERARLLKIVTAIDTLLESLGWDQDVHM